MTTKMVMIMTMTIGTEMFCRTIADRWLVLSLAVGCLRLAPTVDSFACPMTYCTCRYKGGKEAAECAGKRLVALPAGLSGDTQILDVSRNSFEELPKDMFYKAALTNLQKVYLAECRIRKIDDAAFSHLANLVELDLESNLLIAVPTETFVDCPGLRRLNLNHNHIRRIESNAFARLPSLASLELSNCFLEYVGPKAFSGLDHLRHLKLDGNRLVGLPPDVGFPLRSLHGLDLFDNPWRCDCRLRVLRDWLFVDRLPVSAPPLCAEPKRLRDWPIVDVRADDFACEPTAATSHRRTLEAQDGASAAVLECRIHADPPPLIRWSRHDRLLSNLSVQQHHQHHQQQQQQQQQHHQQQQQQQLQDTERQMQKQRQNENERRYVITEMGTVHKTAFLSISDVSWDDAGQYVCVAENVAGRVIVNMTLDVVERIDDDGVAGRHGDGYAAFVGGLALLFVATLVAAFVLFLFLSRMRRRQRSADDVNCKHVPLEKMQLVDQHVKFNVHEEKLELTTSTATPDATTVVATRTAHIHGTKSFTDSIYESVRQQDVMRSDDGLRRSGQSTTAAANNYNNNNNNNNNVNNRPDIVKSAQSRLANGEDSCRSMFGSLFSAPSIFRCPSQSASTATAMSNRMHGDSGASEPILNGTVTQCGGGGGGGGGTSCSSTSSSVSSVPERLRLSVSRDRLLGLGGYSTLLEDNTATPVKRRSSPSTENECGDVDVDVDDDDDNAEDGDRDVADSFATATATATAVIDQSQLMTRSTDSSLCGAGEGSVVDASLTNKSLTMGRGDRRIPFNGRANTKQQGCAASSRGSNKRPAMAGTVPGPLKHANLHGRNYVAVLPPLPAHHFAQIRDSPDEGYEDEVNEEEFFT